MLRKLFQLRLRKSLLRDVRRDESGVTAVEFSFVVIPFLALTFAIMEVGLLFLGNLTLEHAVHDAARLIRTGQAHKAGFNEDKFKEEVCGNVVALFNCMDGIKVDVQSFNSFADVNFSSPLDSDGALQNNFDFDMGDAESIVLVRVFYPWSSLTVFPDLGYGMNTSDMGDGNTLLSASTTFRNEPFGE